MTRYTLVSTDGHAGPPASVYREYLEEPFRVRFDEHQQHLADMRAAMRARGRGTSEDFKKEFDEKTGDAELKVAYDSDRRDAVLDSEGVVAEVLFPDADVLGAGRSASSPFGTGLGSAADAEPDALWAGARAHNRWLADFVAQSPTRRVGLGVLPITAGIDESLAEITRVADAGLGGVMIPTRWFDKAPYNHPMYEPVWAACADAGLIVHTHSGAGPNEYAEGNGQLPIYITEVWFWAARPMWAMLFSGVFDRHPAMKFVVAENGCYWAADLVDRMDSWEGGSHASKKFGKIWDGILTGKPSDHFREHVFFAASVPSPKDINARHQIGVGNIMWGNDLPHPEGTWPHTREWISERYRDVPEDEARLMLGETAIDLYKLDRAALHSLAERIGPTEAEVHPDVAA